MSGTRNMPGGLPLLSFLWGSNAPPAPVQVFNFVQVSRVTQAEIPQITFAP